jgi:NDP-sugar pyrophosphorylase family protein
MRRSASTYGDGVSDVDITDLIRFHREHKTLVTLTAVQLPGRWRLQSETRRGQDLSPRRSPTATVPG